MPKYQIGDFVLYSINGACKIIEIGPLSFGGPDKLYYSMKPVNDGRSTIYLPITKEDEIKRKVLNKKEADVVIEAVKMVKAGNLTISKEVCEPVIKSGDNVEIAKLIKQLRNLRIENRKAHKGLNIQEEKLLRAAEIVFFSELATAYECPMDQVVSDYSSLLD